MQTIGSVKETENFNAACSTAKKNAVLNFEVFDGILEKMEKYILIGSLSEIQAVTVLELFVSQRNIDEIESYCNLEWKNLSYAQIISTIQYLNFPINITIFESLVLAYRKNETESNLEFSSRAFRHLNPI